jgi:hypothetical protein
MVGRAGLESATNGLLNQSVLTPRVTAGIVLWCTVFDLLKTPARTWQILSNPRSSSMNKR